MNSIQENIFIDFLNVDFDVILGVCHEKKSWALKCKNFKHLKTLHTARQADYISISYMIRLAKPRSQHENLNIHSIPSRFSHFKLSKMTCEVFLRHLFSPVSWGFFSLGILYRNMFSFSPYCYIFTPQIEVRNTMARLLVMRDLQTLLHVTVEIEVRGNSPCGRNKIRNTPAYFLKFIA